MSSPCSVLVHRYGRKLLSKVEDWILSPVENEIEMAPGSALVTHYDVLIELQI